MPKDFLKARLKIDLGGKVTLGQDKIDPGQEKNDPGQEKSDLGQEKSDLGHLGAAGRFPEIDLVLT